MLANVRGERGFAERSLQRSEAAVRYLAGLRQPSNVAVAADGTLAFLVVPAPPLWPREAEADLWVAEPGLAARPAVVDRAPALAPLAWSPRERVLAYTASGGESATSLRLFDGSPETREVTRVEGTVEQLQWSRDGRELVALVVDPDGETPSTRGAVRTRDSDGSPIVLRPQSGWRWLLRVDLVGGRRRDVRFAESVWEVAWRGDGNALALVSADATENGWYGAHLAIVDLERASLASVYRSKIQLASLALSPSGRRAAFVEGTSSDRGLTPGRIHLADLDRGTVSPGPDVEDVTWLEWEGDGALLYARWSNLGTAFGRVAVDRDRVEELWSGEATLGYAFRPQLAVGGGLAAAIL